MAKLQFVLKLTTVLLISQVMAASFTCSPTKQGAEMYLKIAGEFGAAFRVRHKGTDVLFCSEKMTCKIYNNSNIFSELENTSSEAYSTTLVVKNTTKELASGIWFLTIYTTNAMQLNVSCTFFENIKDIIFYNEVYNKNFYIKCKAFNLIYKSVCRFLIHINEVYINMTEFNQMENIVNDAKYYQIHCSQLIPRTVISSGIYQVNITIYPNVTNTSDDIKYGTSKIFTFEKGPRVELINCPLRLEEGEDVICICRNMTMVSFIYWYHMNGTSFLTERLNFNALKPKEKFKCNATDDSGLFSTSVFYEPHIYYRKDRIVLTFWFGLLIGYLTEALIIAVLVVAYCIRRRRSSRRRKQPKRNEPYDQLEFMNVNSMRYTEIHTTYESLHDDNKTGSPSQESM